MRIFYLGIPLGAHVLAARGVHLVGGALGPLDLPGRRRLRSRYRDVCWLGMAKLLAPETKALVASLRPDAMLGFFWPRRIPEGILRLAPAGAFGTHPSLLPRWRGPDPYYWTIAAGDRETGVTLHRLGARYDTGPIVAQRRIRVAPREDAWTLARRLDRPALALLCECADRLRAGESLQGTPQDESLVTEAPRPSNAELSVDWQRPVDEVDRRVRAAGREALATLGETTVEIRRAHPHAGTAPRGLRPAEAFRVAGGWAVCCGEGALQLDDVRHLDGTALDPSLHL